MSSTSTLLNIINKKPSVNKLYGNQKNRYALKHRKVHKDYFNFDEGNPHREDWRNQKVKKDKKGKKIGDIYRKRREHKKK